MLWIESQPLQQPLAEINHHRWVKRNGILKGFQTNEELEIWVLLERGHGHDITWILRAMPAPAWVVENWPGSAMIIAVRSKGKRGRKLIDETRY